MVAEEAKPPEVGKVAFPAVVYLADDGLPRSFKYIVIDDCRGFLPPWAWPGPERLRAGGVFDSAGTHHEFDGTVGNQSPISVLTALANGLALGSRLFTLLHGRCSYGPRVIGRRSLSIEDFRSRVRDVIFEGIETPGEFRDYVEVTDRKLALSQSFEQVVEVVRWHILTDGGAVDLAPSSNYYGRTPAV